MIDHYSFGQITIDGETYTDDVIITPEKILEDYWWRDEGHYLQLQDLEQVFAKNPAIFIMGKGNSGRVKISEEVVDKMQDRDIEFKYDKTQVAVKYYNNLIAGSDEKIVAGFHLTC